MIKINSPYTYKTLTRVDDPAGRYYTVDGESWKMPSVTTVLSFEKDTSAINAWVEKVGRLEADRILKESSEVLGTPLHSNLENYIKSGDTPSGVPLARMMTKNIIKNGLINISEVWGLEVNLYYPDLYAGTADLIAIHNGSPAIVDFKNSRSEKKEEYIEDYLCQLGAYAFAHNKVYGGNIDKGVIMMACQTGKYLEFSYEGKEFQTKCVDKWLMKLENYYRKHNL